MTCNFFNPSRVLLQNISMERLFLLPLLLLLLFKINAQQTCKGILTDSISKQPVEFANIGIVGKGIGTVTNDKGEFSFSVPDSLAHEKIKISMIGYKTKTYPAKDFQKHTKILMAENAIALKEVAVTPKKTKIKILGNETKTKSVSAGFASNQLGCELAIRLNIKQPQTYLRKFFLNITYNKLEKPVFRFNVYSVDKDGFPKENILTQNIIIEPTVTPGLIEFDLSPYQIYVDDDVFIAVEWIKDLGNTKDLAFSAKLVGSPTYYRQASQDKWNKLPSIGVGLHTEVVY
jgi:hypothetical protein